MKTTLKYLACFTAAAFVSLLLPHVSLAQVVEGPLDSLFNAAQLIRGRLFNIALTLFSLLFIFEFLESAYGYFKRGLPADKIWPVATVKLLIMLILLSFILFFDMWFPTIIAGFEEAGLIATGGQSGDAYTPIEIYRQGEQFFELAKTKIPPNPIPFIPDIFTNTGISYLIAGVILFFAMIVIALFLAVFTAEAAIAVNLGIIVLGFGSWRRMSSLVDSYVAYIVNLGLRIFILYVLVGLLQPLVTDWIAYVEALPPSYSAAGVFEVVGAAILYAGIAAYVPIKAAAEMTRRFSPGITDLLKEY